MGADRIGMGMGKLALCFARILTALGETVDTPSLTTGPTRVIGVTYRALALQLSPDVQAGVQCSVQYSIIDEAMRRRLDRARNSIP